MWYCRETSQILRSHRRRTYSFESRPPDSAAPAIFLSLPVLKNPRDLLSGDQNGKEAPSVPANACGKSSSSGRTQSTSLPRASGATNASSRPFGEIEGVQSLANSAWFLSCRENDIFRPTVSFNSYGQRLRSFRQGRPPTTSRLFLLFAAELFRSHSRKFLIKTTSLGFLPRLIASRFPSEDQSYAKVRSLKCVICCGGPPVSGCFQRFIESPSSRGYVSARPSGVQWSRE
jgi:hypothetical protein